jgi:hypothetical protein
MKLSEDRISHISHLIADGLWKDELIDYDEEEEHKVVGGIKKVIADYLKVEDEVDAMVRNKISSYSRPIPVGSREWDVLYQKFYKEEMQKRHR